MELVNLSTILGKSFTSSW